MALKKPTSNSAASTPSAAASATAAQFEQEPGDTAVLNETTAPAADIRAESSAKADQPAKADAPAAAAAATTAITTARSSAVATEGAAAEAKKFQKEVEAMKGASDFSYGNYAVFKGNNGEISESGGEAAVLGRWAQVRLLSWDDHFEISPGEQGASSKDFVAYSTDGVTIDSVIGEELKGWVGRTVADYVTYLRDEEEFDKTKCRRFIDTAVALMATDSGDGPIGKVIQITLSESSIPAFSRYQQELLDTARCVTMGLPGFKMPEDPFNFFFIREVAKKGNNTWTKLKISSTLPTKL